MLCPTSKIFSNFVFSLDSGRLWRETSFRNLTAASQYEVSQHAFSSHPTAVASLATRGTSVRVHNKQPLRCATVRQPYNAYLPAPALPRAPPPCEISNAWRRLGPTYTSRLISFSRCHEGGSAHTVQQQEDQERKTGASGHRLPNNTPSWPSTSTHAA